MFSLFDARYVVLAVIYLATNSGASLFRTASPSFLRIDEPTLRTSENVQGFGLTDEEMRKFKIWPQGIIPYFIDELSFDKVLRDRIRFHLGKFSGITPLQFVELHVPPNDENERWVLFVNRRGQLSCVDYTTKSFTNSGVQKIVLGYDCLGAGDNSLAATVLALAGVPPQHNAPNRDEFITVFTDNILPDKLHLFDVLTDQDWLFHDLDYDLASAGHYDLYMYTSNGQQTISLQGSTKLPHHREEENFSSTDMLKLNMLYKYIKKKKNAAPECSKLFKAGKNFDSFQTLTNEEKPRKTPMKYLSGVPNKNPPKSKPKNPPKNSPKVSLGNTPETSENPTGNHLVLINGLGAPAAQKKRQRLFHITNDTVLTHQKLTKQKIAYMSDFNFSGND